jgi:ribosomal protein S18 acetylase RimI-like enzyme
MHGQGVGSALVRHLLQATVLGPKSTVVLDVATTNDKARRRYQRLGFEVVGERRSHLANAQAVLAGHHRMQWRADGAPFASAVR